MNSVISGNPELKNISQPAQKTFGHRREWGVCYGCRYILYGCGDLGTYFTVVGDIWHTPSQTHAEKTKLDFRAIVNYGPKRTEKQLLLRLRFARKNPKKDQNATRKNPKFRLVVALHFVKILTTVTIFGSGGARKNNPKERPDEDIPLCFANNNTTKSQTWILVAIYFAQISTTFLEITSHQTEN